jgi:hypothetical protein
MRKLITAAMFICFSGLVFESEAAWALCKPGNKNCVTASSNRPKFCGSAGNPCKLDVGLGSECKGAGADCGVAGQTLPDPGK